MALCWTLVRKKEQGKVSGKKEKDKEEEDTLNEESFRSGPKLSSPEKTPVFVVSSGPKPVKSGCGVSGPVFDPDVLVSGALFSVDGRSTLPGSENDMSMNQYLKGFEEELVLGDTPPLPFAFLQVPVRTLPRVPRGTSTFVRTDVLFWKRASRGDRFAECGPCWLWCSGTFSCWHWSACFCVPGDVYRSLRLTGVSPALARSLSLASRHVDASSHDSDLAMLSLSSSRVPCSSASAVSAFLVVVYFRGLFRLYVYGVRLLLGLGHCVRSGTQVVSVCVHDSGTDLIDHNAGKHGHEAAGGTRNES